MSAIVKTSQHATKFMNKRKESDYNSFLAEYRRVAQAIVDEIWINGYEWKDKNDNSIRFFPRENKLDLPLFLDYNKFQIETFLSARALSSLVTQLRGMLSASVEKQRKRLFVLNQNKKNGTSKKNRHLLGKKIKQNIPQKPNCSKINAEISSKCCDWKHLSNSHFDGFLSLKSISKNKIKINIPIKLHKHSNILAHSYSMLNSFLITDNAIQIRWKKDTVSKKIVGNVVGADQGLKDVLTLSDKQKPKNSDSHGHSLESITRKLCRKKKGSKAFKRTQDHRKNFINWSIKQIDFSNIRELKLEQIWNIGYKSRTSRILSHWTNTLIRDKVESICEENGVHLIHQSSTYRSQRCFGCGIVRKANRKGKIYSCKHCGYENDADYNASKNHEIDLPEIPYTLRKLQKNRKDGFYWLETGFYDFVTGKSLESLPLVEDRCHDSI